MSDATFRPKNALDIVIQLQQLGDSTPHNQGRSTIYAAISEIERLRNYGDMLEMAARQGVGLDDALDKWGDARG